MAASLSFKVYLSAGGRQEEVRRFAVTQPPQLDLHNLNNKIAAVFPHLGDRKHELMWEDKEGDRVSIDSEEELRLALRDMGGAGVYRLYVRLVDSHWWSQGRGKKEAALNSQGEEHPGVICCCCHLQVKGFRYKCTVCPNYDMCGGCEDKAMHPAHDMVRIPTPRSYPPHFFTRLHRLYERCTHSSPTLVKPATSLSSPNEQMARDLVDEDSSDLSDMELEVSLVSSDMSAILTSRTRNRSDSGTPNRNLGRSRLDSGTSTGRPRMETNSHGRTTVEANTHGWKPMEANTHGRTSVEAHPHGWKPMETRTPIDATVQRDNHNQLEQLPSFEELTRSMLDLAEKDDDDTEDNKRCSDAGDLINCDNKNVMMISDEEEKMDNLKRCDGDEVEKKEEKKAVTNELTDAKDESDNVQELSGVDALQELQISRGAFTSLRQQDSFPRNAQDDIDSHIEKEPEEVKEVDTSESLRNLQQEIESLLAPLSPLPDLETVNQIQKIRLAVSNNESVAVIIENDIVVIDKDMEDANELIILNNNKESTKNIKETANCGKIMHHEDGDNCDDDWNIVDKDKGDLINLVEDDKDSTVKEETDNESSTTENEDQVDNDSSLEEDLPNDADSNIHDETESIIPQIDPNEESEDRDSTDGDDNPSKWAVRLDKEIKDLENSAIASSRYISKNIERVGINTRLEDSLKNIENSLKTRSTKFSYGGSASDGDSPSFSRSSSNSSNTSSLPSPQERYIPPQRYLASHHAQSGAAVSLGRGYSSTETVHPNIKSHINTDTSPVPGRSYTPIDNGGRHLIGCEKLVSGVASRHYPSSDNSASGGQGRHYNPRIADALDKMLGMGFTDDDGWLTQLLVMKHGDISQVLDVLTPVQQQQK